MRKPLQGLRNVVRFNWPYYSASAAALIIFGLIAFFSAGTERWIAVVVIVISVLAPFISLVVTTYVYDLSGFYELKWLEGLAILHDAKVLNINAGFDETSVLLAKRFPAAELIVCDFYDPQRHTEASIARARRAYPPFTGTRSIRTTDLPFENESIDAAFAIMSAHEIRDAAERIAIFAELNRSLANDGTLVVVEHLRDAANMFAYTLGAWHFHSRPEWLRCFELAGFSLAREKKLTPFVSAFFLKKNGTSS